jgi:hypothetical protein
VKSLAANRAGVGPWQVGARVLVRCRAGPVDIWHWQDRATGDDGCKVLHEAAKDRRYHETDGHTQYSLEREFKQFPKESKKWAMEAVEYAVILLCYFYV